MDVSWHGSLVQLAMEPDILETLSAIAGVQCLVRPVLQDDGQILFQGEVGDHKSAPFSEWRWAFNWVDAEVETIEAGGGRGY